MPKFVNPSTGVTVDIPKELADKLGYFEPAKAEEPRRTRKTQK